MPLFRERLIFNVGKNLRGFLNLDAGLSRKSSSNTAPEKTAVAAPTIEQPPPEKPSAPEPKKPRALAKPAEPREEAQNRVLKAYGYLHGLPEVDLLDVLPDLDETVSVNGTSSGPQAPGAIALIKGLAKKSPDCRALQIGSSPRTTIAANLARACRECLSVTVGDEVHATPSLRSSLLVEQATYDVDSDDVSYHARSFGYNELKNSFDLVSVDGHGPSDSVETATTTAFEFLKPGNESMVVWNVRQNYSRQVDQDTLAAILNGSPDGSHDKFYYVPSTSQVLWTHRNLFDKSNTVEWDSNEVIDVRFSTRSTARRLILLDDGFPSRRSAFRISEYNSYLERWSKATLYSTTKSFTALGEKRSFGQVLEDYSTFYPQLGDRVFKFHEDLDLGGDLAYFVFLNNAMRFLPNIEESGSPFAFTLYPGGGFRLHQKDSDENLRRVCSSPSFRKVIATQKVTQEYLLDGDFCRPEDVEFVYGGVFPFSDALNQAVPRRYYKKDKDTFDVCFVAYKYTERSLKSKGYDVFAEVVRQLSKDHDDIRFHVVGNFDENDIDVSDAGEKIKFYGSRPTEFFPSFYSNMDAIISPNASFVLQPGAFDGFPTGSCMEAGMCGVAVFCSDPLKQNLAFKDGEDMVIIPRDTHDICASLNYYRENYEQIRNLADKGQQAFTRVFDIEAQMKPRLRILSELLGESGATQV